MAEATYRKIYNIFKSQIQQGIYGINDYLPSENELCRTYSITRTTARKALDELIKDGFIEKQHGKGSMVKERRKSLGLLTVKGFSEAVDDNIQSTFLQHPAITDWPDELPFTASEEELKSDCIYFERLRGVNDTPVMRECNWFSASEIFDIVDRDFVEGSFFKTLSQKYLIEIIGSEQEIRAVFSDEVNSTLLHAKPRSPILQVSIKFTTSRPGLNIYSYLYCNTVQYPIGNFYKH